MTASNEAWISDSLARLEQLEAQREQLARTGRTEALAELDEEIKSLYEVLESAAEEEGTEAANNSPAPNVPHPAFGPTPSPMVSQMMAQPQPVAAPQPQYSAPQEPVQQYSAPQYAAPQYSPPQYAEPQYSVPEDVEVPSPGFAPMPSMDASIGDDEPGGGKGAIIAVAVVVVLALGGGGWWFMNRAPAAAPVEAPAGPAKVIQAGAIPDDTQEPDVAKGGEASRTPGIVIKQPAAQNDSRPSGPRPSSSSGSSKPSKPEKTRSDIDVAKGNDPLAGIR